MTNFAGELRRRSGRLLIPSFDEEVVMSNNSRLTLIDAVATTRTPANHRVVALWHTMVGKKVVMAVTGVVLILFVIAHMVGNLKIFSGPDEIDAYSRFLREVGMPELGYGQLLWLVRILMLTCVTLHVTAAVQLTRLSRAARPIGYASKKDIETSWG